MRKQFKLEVEVGDANYVKPGEYFAELTDDGKFIKKLFQRQDDLSLKVLVDPALDLEDEKEVTADSTVVTVSPSTGKAAMKKAKVNIPLGEYEVEIDPEHDTFPMEIALPSGAEYIGFSKVTLTTSTNATEE